MRRWSSGRGHKLLCAALYVCVCVCVYMCVCVCVCVCARVVSGWVAGRIGCNTHAKSCSGIAAQDLSHPEREQCNETEQPVDSTSAHHLGKYSCTFVTCNCINEIAGGTLEPGRSQNILAERLRRRLTKPMGSSRVSSTSLCR